METILNTPVTINLTEDDVVAADQLYSWSGFRDPANWRPVAMVWIAVQGVLLAIYLFSGMNSTRFFEFAKFVEIGMLLGTFVVPILAMRFVGPRNARRHFKAMKILHGPIELTWAAEGLTEKTSTSSSLTPWNHFPKWREDEASFIIFVAPTMYRVVPKRFLTEGQNDDLRAHLKQCLGA
jgi:YcxB-like protein